MSCWYSDMALGDRIGVKKSHFIVDDFSKLCFKVANTFVYLFLPLFFITLYINQTECFAH